MLTKSSIYLVRALVILARLPEGKYSGATAIAKEIGSPQNYLGKTLKLLSQRGLLTSQKGFGGGFRLAKPASTVSLLEIVEPIEHISAQPHCVMGQKQCSEEKPCALHHKWKKIREGQIRLLEETMLQELVDYYDVNSFQQGLYNVI